MAVDVAAPLLRMVWPDEATELDLEPLQGLWSVEQYLRLSNQTNHLIEFTDGVIEMLPMPTDSHQAISRWLFLALLAFVQRIGGTVTVLTLAGDAYVEHGVFRRGETATSALLAGFTALVDAVFDVQ